MNAKRLQFVVQGEGDFSMPETLFFEAEEMVDAVDLNTKISSKVRASQVTIYRNLLILKGRPYSIRSITPAPGYGNTQAAQLSYYR